MAQSQRFSLAWMTALFFLWGFLTEMDGALIPFLKKLYTLSNFEAALVQFSFFIAFVLLSWPSAWLLGKLGYKKVLVAGLCVAGAGSLLFYPAATQGYLFFLVAIFTLAAGVTLLQVAANPYVARLGDEVGASARLNLAQGFNSMAKVLAPVVGAWLILNKLKTLPEDQIGTAVQGPYLVFGAGLFLLALIFAFLPLPSIENEAQSQDTPMPWRKYPHLLRGAGAIFFYVGAEVCIGTFLAIFLNQSHMGSLPLAEGARYLSIYWGLMMAGRLLGPYILRFIGAGTLLFVSATGATLCILTVLFSSGTVAMVALLGTGLFHSIMWSNIFSLSIAELGPHTPKGSGLLIAAIAGGAVLPPVQGWLSDLPGIGLHHSYAILLVAYAYIFWFGYAGYRIKNA
ncbi:MAG: sugar MFS transporter [Bacteroidetes bacterium]|nr:sugar MFS transporter [Bacteroidota bacterium]